MSNQIYGIDLGTTYSALSRIDEFGLPRVVKNHEGDDTTPSVIFFEGANNIVVGAEAKRAAVADPDNAVSLIKRHMGQRYDVRYQGKDYTPESLSALILKEMVNAANAVTGDNVNKVVITVPAYFGAQERESTKTAGKTAGLDVVGIVTEPVAAALSITANSQSPETLLVYDLGGGTFDTTVIKVDLDRTDGPPIETVATGGERLLGGADWDDRLAGIVVDKLKAQLGITHDPLEDVDFRVELLQEIEDRKKTLSKREASTLRLNYEGARATVEVTRAEFEEATRDLVAQTIEATRRTIQEARSKYPGLVIDRVLMVGGSSKMPMIAEALRANGWNPQPTEYDLAVALGASIYGVKSTEHAATAGSGHDAGDVGGLSESVFVSNVLSRALGILWMRKDGSKYIKSYFHAQQALPAGPEIDQGFTRHPGQAYVLVELFEQGGQAESENPDDNRKLADVMLPIPPGSAAGYPVNIVLNITDEGLCTVDAVDPQTGQTAWLEGAISILSQEEIQDQTTQVGMMRTRS